MATPESTAPATEQGLQGESVHFFVFDIAYDMQRIELRSLLGHKLEPVQIDTPRKQNPRGQSFYRPLTARLPALQRTIHGEPVTVSVSIKLIPVGALSIMARVPFAVPSADDLRNRHDLTFDGGESLYEWARNLAEKVCAELVTHAIRPHPRLPEGETYTVFCADCASPAVAGSDAASWLAANRHAIAGLLTRESSPCSLSEQEITEATSRWLSYYRHDLVVADWDAAIIVDRPPDFDETLYVMELANVQLEELKAYDLFLDEALERAYRDLGNRRGGNRTAILRELGELRIDLARFSDELSNISKFFGEWHLARVYENVSRIFHLSEWHQAIDGKLRTLDGLYDTLKQDQNHRIMFWLELSIVVLFIIDVGMLLAGTGK